ncbi:MAG TPA: O-antigen ligase family protein [Rhodothermales bacterium]|nr:O-antigen ligase family protein [Rhodothermales bacterium]
MNLFSPSWTPSPVALQRGGAALLWAGFGMGLSLLLALLWWAPELLPVLTVLLVAGAGIPYLLRRPFLHLCVTLSASFLVLEHKPEIQVQEVLYGLYASFFLAWWFFDELVRRRTPLFASLESRVLLYFLLYVAALVPVSFFFGATPYTVVRELHALVMLGFFFPIREACVRYRHGPRALLLIALGLSLFVVFRNLVNYQSVLYSSDQLIGVIQGRIIANDHVLAASSLFTFVFLLYSTRVRQTLSYLVLFLLCFSGLLLTLGRAFWMSFALGVLFLFFVVDRRHKMRILLYGSSAAVPLLAIGLFFFGHYVELFLEGLLARLTSVEGSLSRDISLMGRITEAQGALARIEQNPVLGHGAGVPFEYNNIISRTRVTTTFVHVGYLYLWYAFGLLGGGLMLFLWGRSVWCGLRSFRVREAPLTWRLAGLGAAATLVAFTLSAMTSNPFWHKDYLLGLAYIMGLACGVHARATAGRAAPAPA